MEKFSQTTPNIEKVKKQETEYLFLNEWDKKYLEKGASGMISKMYNDFGNDFPDIIVLAERGARPLYQLLYPIFNKLNFKKGTKIPKFIFFSVSAKAEINSTSEDMEKLIIARERMKSRAEEIVERNNDNLKLVIVDDFLSNGDTIREIKRAFNNEEMPAYTLLAFSGSDDSATPGYIFNDESDGKNPGVDRYAFSFEDQGGAIGVEKSFNQKYSIVIKKDSPEKQKKLVKDKKLLRAEVTVFGNELAGKISEIF